jgi:hypothetical protein
MNRKFHISLLAALAASTVVFAQETQPGQGEQPSQEQPAQPEPDAGKTPLPDIDVWEDTEEGLRPLGVHFRRFVHRISIRYLTQRDRS